MKARPKICILFSIFEKKTRKHAKAFYFSNIENKMHIFGLAFILFYQNYFGRFGNFIAVPKVTNRLGAGML